MRSQDTRSRSSRSQPESTHWNEGSTEPSMLPFSSGTRGHSHGTMREYYKSSSGSRTASSFKQAYYDEDTDAPPVPRSKHEKVYDTEEQPPPIPRSIRTSRLAEEQQHAAWSSSAQPGAFREGRDGRNRDLSVLTQSSLSPSLSPPMITAQLVQDPSLVDAVPHHEESPSSPQDGTPPPPPAKSWWSKRRNQLMVGGLVGLVLILVIVVIALVVVVSNSNDGQSSSSSAAAPPPTTASTAGPTDSTATTAPGVTTIGPTVTIPSTPLPTTVATIATMAPSPAPVLQPKPTGFPTPAPTVLPLPKPTPLPTPQPVQQTPQFTFPPTEPTDCEEDNLLLVQFVLDGRQSETKYELRDGSSGSVLTEDGPFEESSGLTVSTIQYCVTDASYIFAVLDSAGDGLSGNGAYRIEVNGVELPTEKFTNGFQQSTPILIPLAEPLACTGRNLLVFEFAAGGASTEETSWELSRQSDGEIVSSSEGPFSPGISSTRSEICIDDGAYTFTIFDSESNGLEGAAYSVALNGMAIQTDEFMDGSERSVDFNTSDR